MMMNHLKFAVVFLLLTLATACGGSKQPKEGTTEPSSQSYPPQNPGDEDKSDTISVAPPASASVSPGQSGTN